MPSLNNSTQQLCSAVYSPVGFSLFQMYDASPSVGDQVYEPIELSQADENTKKFFGEFLCLFNSEMFLVR